MILLPTRGRPEQLRRFIAAYEATECVLPITLLMDKDDADCYRGVPMPEHWIVELDERMPIVKRMNKYFDEHPDLDFYGIMSDDCVPVDKNWDTKLVQAAGDWNVAHGYNTEEKENTVGWPLLGGELVRSFGFIAPPVLNHFCADDFWYQIAIDLKIQVTLDLEFEHHHFTNGKAFMDKTYKERPNAALDIRNYQSYLRDNYLEEFEMVWEKMYA